MDYYPKYKHFNKLKTTHFNFDFRLDFNYQNLNWNIQHVIVIR